MPNRIRHIVSSSLLLLFLWQIAFLCGNNMFQDERVTSNTECFEEEIQEDDNLFDGFSSAMSEEEVERHSAISYINIFYNPEIKTLHKKQKEDYFLSFYSKIPIPPPEMIS